MVKKSGVSTFLSLLIVTMAGVLSAILFIVAIVEWLALYFDSVVIPCLLLGVLLLFVSVVVYHTGLKERVREWEEHTAVIYEVTHLIREGYMLAVRWLSRKL